MKILIFGQNSDSFSLFSDVFRPEKDFFDIYFANFLEKDTAKFYDAILTEYIFDNIENFVDIPIVLLRPAINISQSNIIFIEKCIPEIIRNTLKKIYHSSLKNTTNKVIIPYKDIIQNSNVEKKILIEVSNDSYCLKKIYQSLNFYQIPQLIIRHIGVILSEIIVNSFFKHITSIIEIYNDKINLVIPKHQDIPQLYSIRQFCNSFISDDEGIRLTINYN